MNQLPVSQVLKQRLSLAAQRLGVCDPGLVLGEFLDRTFAWPMGDWGYGDNLHVMGELPLEYSFSELAPNALRLDFQPLPTDASAIERRTATTEQVRRLIAEHYGNQSLRWFDERSEIVRSERFHPKTPFGALFGAGVDAVGLSEVKGYFEITQEQLGDLSPQLRDATTAMQMALPHLTPLFFSLACGREKQDERLYYYFAKTDGDLTPENLPAALEPLGLAHHWPELSDAIALMTGGDILPRHTTVFGLRHTSQGYELKVEVCTRGLELSAPQLQACVMGLLAARPAAQTALQRWMRAVTPDGYDDCGQLFVISLRFTPQTGARLNLYICPAGYELQRPLAKAA